MAALAASAVVLLGHRLLDVVLLDRPPDEPEQPGDRELEDEHQIDERPGHSGVDPTTRPERSPAPAFDPWGALVRTA
jgi:hypothetical protein